MPKVFPLEFRRDVVAVARSSDAPVREIAKDFGISELCLRRWLKAPDVEDGVCLDVTSDDSAELGEANKRIQLLEQENQILRRATLYLRRGVNSKMMYPLVLDLAADEIAVAMTCRVLGFGKQAFYAWRASPVSQRDWDNAHLINAARVVHADQPKFGYRLIANELVTKKGFTVSENRVGRLCSQEGLVSVNIKGKGSGKKAGSAAR